MMAGYGVWAALSTRRVISCIKHLLNAPSPSLTVLPDSQQLAQAAAKLFQQLAQQAIASQGRFTTALSGGSTPEKLYRLLALDDSLDWAKIHLFWGDERCVPPDHSFSNYRMVRQALLERSPIPPENIHRMYGELDPIVSASQYEQELRQLFPTSKTFDLFFLGLGEDGHTASLFPGSPALTISDRWVAHVAHTQPPPPLVDRLTLTLPAINAAAQVVFLVSGAGKAPALKEALYPSAAPPPAALVQPTSGKLLWLVDREAAVAALG